MELYLDSANLQEVNEAFELGFLAGLTTTPTFMQRQGVTDLDGTIVELSQKVPVLQIEALGRDADTIVSEAKRQEALGLARDKTVYKIPMSLEGAKACKMLTDEGFQVNLHLVYTVQQAYLAMTAGATYVCPLVGRLQDQGVNALDLVAQIVDIKHQYGFDTKVMFSSVRHLEHVRNAISLGVDTITVPWKILKSLSDNHLTSLGTEQFYTDHHRVNTSVKEVMRESQAVVNATDNLGHVLLAMSQSGLGAAVVADASGQAAGMFTDGDLRRHTQSGDNLALDAELGSIHEMRPPLTIEAHEKIDVALAIMKEREVDQLVVTESGRVIGLVDIQDLLG